MFIKKYKKNTVGFENVWAKSVDFLSFYVKISQNWLKFLGCPQNFWRITLKNVKMLLKN